MKRKLSTVLETKQNFLDFAYDVEASIEPHLTSTNKRYNLALWQYDGFRLEFCRQRSGELSYIMLEANVVSVDGDHLQNIDNDIGLGLSLEPADTKLIDKLRAAGFSVSVSDEEMIHGISVSFWE